MPTVKDIYSKFGFVAEAGQILETQLGNLLLLQEAVDADLIETPDSSVANDIYNRINRYTLGQLIKNTKSKKPSLDQIEEMLAAALVERNRLAHSFYREHNFRLRDDSDEGRTIMLEDLERMHDVILEAYKAVMLLSGIDLDNIETVPEEYRSVELHGHVKI